MMSQRAYAICWAYERHRPIGTLAQVSLYPPVRLPLTTHRPPPVGVGHTPTHHPFYVVVAISSVCCSVCYNLHWPHELRLSRCHNPSSDCSILKQGFQPCPSQSISAIFSGSRRSREAENIADMPAHAPTQPPFGTGRHGACLRQIIFRNRRARSSIS